MTKKGKNQLKAAAEKIESVFYWDNRNLLKRQFYKLDDALEIINELLKD